MYSIRMISTVTIKIEITGSVKYWIFALKFKLYFYLNCLTRRSGRKSYNDHSISCHGNSHEFRLSCIKWSKKNTHI